MRREIAVIAALAALLAAGIVVGPGLDLAGTGTGDTELTETSHSTTGPDTSSVGSTPGATATPVPSPQDSATGTTSPQASIVATTVLGEPFEFSLDDDEKCGQTCRRVTGTLTNEQFRPATNVSMEFRVYASNGTESRPIWTATESVGSLSAGQSVSVTREIDLSSEDVYRIAQNDGWITVQTTIRSGNETMTTSERRNVS